MSKNKINNKEFEAQEAEYTPAESEGTPEEVPPVVESKGKDMKILGLKVHVEKAEKVKKVKKEKPVREKPSKGKIAAGIGGGLLVAGAIAKGVFDVLANQATADQQSVETEGVYLPTDSAAEEACTEPAPQSEADASNVDQA